MQGIISVFSVCGGFSVWSPTGISKLVAGKLPHVDEHGFIFFFLNHG